MLLKRTGSHGIETIYGEQKGRILGFLKENPVGVLATVDAQSKPSAVVIYHSVDDHVNVAFVTKTGTKKHANLQQNDNATLVVFEPNTQAVVQVEGRVKLISSRHKTHRVYREIVAAAMKTSEYGIPPISKLRVGEYIAYQLVPDQVRMTVYARPDPGSYDELFEVLTHDEIKEF